MWVVYTFLILIGIVLLSMIVFGIIISFFYSKPKCMTYKETKEHALKLETYFNYDELKCESYKIECRDGYKLNARLFKPQKETNKYVIMLHGFTATQVLCSTYIPLFLDLGFNVITYDERNHGINEKSITTMSLNESKDFIFVVDDTYKRFGKDIYLGAHGESMGASTLISSMRYNPKLKFIISDCAFSDLYKLTKEECINTFKLPSFLILFSGVICRILFGWNPFKVIPYKDMNNSRIPLLLIHGLNDKMVHYSHSERIYNNYNGYKELVLIEGADHAQSYKANKTIYTKKIKEFLDNNVN